MTRARALRLGSRCLVVAGLLLGVVLGPRTPARAGPSPEPATTTQARTLFRAGAEAYAEGYYRAALHAFDAARALVPDPALTFSIAQAHRRQYYVDEAPRHLRAAVREYQRYLTEVGKGGRRGDAKEALAELEPKLAVLGEAAADEAPGRLATRLMVLSSVAGAWVRLDGGPAERAPFVGEIEPGTHVVRVGAEGYRTYDRTVPIRPGDVVALDAVLQELPAQLLVRGDDGSNLWVDGRAVGVLPLDGPVATPPGRRLISVTRDGFRRFELESRLERGERKDLRVELEPTAQRTLSIVALVLGGAGLTAGGIFAAVAAKTYDDAEEIYERAQVQNIEPDELASYAAVRDDHQPWTVAAVATGAVGLALAITGGLLFWVDPAPPPSQVARAPQRAPAVRLGLGVTLSPGGGGLGATVQF